MKGQNLLPARAFPPGATIRQELEARSWTQKQFASLLGRPEQYVSELVNGKRQVTVDAAQELEAALGPSAQFWLSLETNYRLWLAVREGESDRVRDIRARVQQSERARAS